MIETKNERIDVAALQARIDAEAAGIAGRGDESPAKAAVPRNLVRDVEREIEEYVAEAERKSAARHELPPKLDRFPFRLLRAPVLWMLRVHALLFRDQRAVNRQLADALRLVAAYERTLHDFVEHLRETVALQEAALRRLEARAGESVPGKGQGNGGASSGVDVDRFQYEFAKRFRGSRADLKKSFDKYADVIRELALGPNDAVLDLACGRGEWVEWLAEHGIRGEGVDLNPHVIEDCFRAGVTARRQDLFDALAERADGSLALVTAFHIVEHLDFATLSRFGDEVVRVLRPGGAVILETPNPANVLVGACTFWMDPTHVKPLPGLFLQYFLESKGFSDVRLLHFDAYDDSYLIREGPERLVSRFNDLFFGCQNTAAVARRAAGR
ncbi:MAG: class I SAM-dependent methyltransferase [bacterium]